MKKFEEETRRMQEELNETLRKKAQEQKEREEYERLKKKFEEGLYWLMESLKKLKDPKNERQIKKIHEFID